MKKRPQVAAVSYLGRNFREKGKRDFWLSLNDEFFSDVGMG